MVEGFVAFAAGVVLLAMIVAQWVGWDWTDHHPDTIPGRGYLNTPSAIALIILGIALVIPDIPTVVNALIGVSMVLLATSLVLNLVRPKRLRPEWQKRQVEWLEANAVDGRYPRWATRPEEWKYQGWLTKRSRRFWGLDGDPDRVRLRDTGAALRGERRPSRTADGTSSDQPEQRP